MSHENPTNLNYVGALNDFHYSHDIDPFIALVTGRVMDALHPTVQLVAQFQYIN
jgi:hypothetical protein